MPEVFINYRTGDGEQTADALEKGLSARFGDGMIFRAAKSIKPGALFDDELLIGVRKSSVLIAVVGEYWAESPRLHDEDDWVRREILEAFRCAVTVVPVLLGRRTERLKASSLPPELGKLARCHSLRYDTQDRDGLRRIGDFLAEEVPALEEAERALKEAGESAEPGATNNSMGEVTGGTVTQARDVTGGISSTNIERVDGYLHTGSGDQHHHAPHQTGDGSSYVAGDQHDGGNRNTFGEGRHRRDDER